MEFLFDSANLEAIQTYSACFPITGVTSNPSILKAEGKIDLFGAYAQDPSDHWAG